MIKKTFLLLNAVVFSCHLLSSAVAMEDAADGMELQYIVNSKSTTHSNYGTDKQGEEEEGQHADNKPCHWGLEHWFHGVNNIIMCKTDCNLSEPMPYEPLCCHKVSAGDENSPSLCGVVCCPLCLVWQLCCFLEACRECSEPDDERRRNHLPYCPPPLDSSNRWDGGGNAT